MLFRSSKTIHTEIPSLISLQLYFLHPQLGCGHRVRGLSPAAALLRPHVRRRPGRRPALRRFKIFMKPFEKSKKNQISLSFEVRVTRIVASIIGFASVGIAVAASEFDGILQLGVTAVGLVSGPLLAVFVLGLFTTVANKVVRSASSLSSRSVCSYVM